MTADLRLVPTAFVTWVAAWVLTTYPAAAQPAGYLLAASAVGAAALSLLLSSRAFREKSCSTAHVFSRKARPLLAHAALALAAVTVIALAVLRVEAGRQPVIALAGQRAAVTITGTVASDARPAFFGEGYTWMLDIDTLTARTVTTTARAQVEVASPSEPPRYGARIEVSGDLRLAKPGAMAAARLTAGGWQAVRAPPVVVAVTNAMRESLLAVTDDLSAQARGLVPGMAVGDTSRMPDDLAAAFKTSSLTHLTAVSGGHFAVVLALVTGLATTMRLPRAVRALTIAAIAAGFVLLVRPEPSVLRSAAMCAVVVLGIVLGRPASALPSLALSVCVLLCVDPWLSRSYGFALSCAATVGLVLLTPPLLERLAPWLGRSLGFALAVPVAAQLACGPILILFAPSVPTMGVLANLLVAPAVAPATLLGLGATITAPWLPAVAHALAWLAGCATWWIAAVARWCAALPLARVPWPGGIGGAIALAAATGLVLFLALRRPPGIGWVNARLDKKSRRSLLAAVAVVAVVVGSPVAVRLVLRDGQAPEDWQVAACDVGQGDALVIRSGPNAAIVVDVGPPGSAAGICLDQLGVTRIDLLVLSHYHADHVGGLAEVLSGREVMAAWVSPLAQPEPAAAQTIRSLAQAGVTPQIPMPGGSLLVGEEPWQVTITTLGPGAVFGSESGSEEGDPANDASLAVHLRASGPGGALNIMALGDLEESGQVALLTAWRADPALAAVAAQPVHVVKVAHHGSASQSIGLARALSPQVALLSVGENTYGHPASRALNLYAQSATIVRTDDCGTAALTLREGQIMLACTSSPRG
ncbi:MAG: ComEC/Rec2 family competence protein [Promicromonosporaceae bacterium]|nr:ComEC/Rec2 family competence protein [Promicromonosporaceae bacterium]